MISVPVQYNYDEKLAGIDGSSRDLTNIQPVVPFTLNDDWSIVSRTILPIVNIDSGHGQSINGNADILQSVFFSPDDPYHGWLYGFGAVLSLPVASEPELGSEKWSLGPTAVVLKQEHGWTYGMLVNQLLDVAGDDDRESVNETFLQPFAGYTWHTATSLFLNSESIIDWENDTQSVPVNLMLSQVVPIAGQIFSFQVGARYWADSAPADPEGTGFRFNVTWVFLKDK
ncbi:transporter [Agaribacterium haliotis]|uniref:transporter n=1 Tax=Agaribacterium haliotis TaxID=2013869 RepID=UPI0018647566|nr:transporter [Agaribacterium haliotis]